MKFRNLICLAGLLTGSIGTANAIKGHLGS